MFNFLKPKEMPKINDVNDIKEYPDEARRQIHLFHDNIHRKDWADTDFKGTEPEQDTKKRDAFLSKYKLRKLPSTAPEDSPHEVARHLDHYHHHYPEIAKRFNMKPMTPTNSKILIAKSDVNVGMFRAKQAVKRFLTGKKKPDPGFETKPDPTNPNGPPLVRAKKGSGLESILADVDKMYDKHVADFHANNPDLHHLAGSQTYGHFYTYFGNKGKMLTPMKRQNFEPRWDKLTKKTQTSLNEKHHLQFPGLSKKEVKKSIKHELKKREIRRNAQKQFKQNHPELYQEVFDPLTIGFGAATAAAIASRFMHMKDGKANKKLPTNKPKLSVNTSPPKLTLKQRLHTLGHENPLPKIKDEK